MTLRTIGFALSMIALAPLAFAGFAFALTASCTGTPSATSITWQGSGSNGVAPYVLLWGNGATSSSQTINVSPGTYAMHLQVTDASSTVATTTCSATVNQAAPTVSSFTASPASITAGQSSTLSFVVSNASSTSINNGVGVVSSTSVIVSPSVTTMYTLTATNPGGSTTANATVTVTATSTGTNVTAQIKALLDQIEALKKQIAQLIAGAITGGTIATSTPECFHFDRDLKHGDRGEDVRELQHWLAHDDPSLFPPGLITGFFGPKTQAAVKMWQRRFGIDPIGTGFFGMKSRGHMKGICSNGDSDHDGIRNVDDSDDDNDGTPDMSDGAPFNPNATTTKMKWDDRDERGKKGEHGKKGERGRDGRDGDDDE